MIEQFTVIEQIGEPAKSPDKVKEYLQNIIKIFTDNSVSDGEINSPGNESKIPESDIQVSIMPEICRVLNFYEITSDQCRAVDEVTPPTSSLTSLASGSSSTLVTILKWAGIVVGVLAAIFLLIVGFFAIKAKMQQEEEEEEGQIKETN